MMDHEKKISSIMIPVHYMIQGVSDVIVWLMNDCSNENIF